MIFMQSAIDKMDDKVGRAAIIENNSPLFTGGTASGESQIRRWILKKDLLEAIIALPTDLFYNTGIATYVWILSKNKRPERKGYVQLIDATSIFHKLRKAAGNKRNELLPEDRSKIVKLYTAFEENEYCKIFKNEEFMYREYTVMQPLQRSYAITEERIQQMLADGTLNSVYDPAKVDELEEQGAQISVKDKMKLDKLYEQKPVYEAIISVLQDAVSDEIYIMSINLQMMRLIVVTFTTYFAANYMLPNLRVYPEESGWDNGTCRRITLKIPCYSYLHLKNRGK